MEVIADGIYLDSTTGAYLFAPWRIAATADKLGIKGEVLAAALVQTALTADLIPHLAKKAS